MIVVLADDLTGATELGGVAWRYGLTAEVHTAGGQSCSAEVLTLDTNTRGSPSSEAARGVEKACRLLPAHTCLYKKIDSVLRGPVLVEVEAALASLGLPRALVVPANPQLGRVIRDGHYFVGGQPIHETDFKDDPHYPRHSSRVLDLLGASLSQPVSVCGLDEPLPTQGIIVGEASSSDDLLAWAGRLDETVLPVGGAEFFAAILGLQQAGTTRLQRPPPELPEASPALFVCGSMAASALDFLDQCEQRGVPVLSLPPAVLTGAADTEICLSRLVEETVGAFRRRNLVLLTIAHPPVRVSGPGRRLEELLARTANAVVEQASVRRVYVEGGATAAAMVRVLGWSRMQVLREWAPGVVTLSSPPGRAVTLTSKPGSYLWPAGFWR
jgi:D-threonate/D-erythronate kinase